MGDEGWFNRQWCKRAPLSMMEITMRWLESAQAKVARAEKTIKRLRSENRRLRARIRELEAV